ncbi:MAG: transporter substrate-binding domain-containing protein [Rhodospirillales bacterium]|nr:transporter substrate-binding domain-containing protein [Rhodospirillales bacterium]
MQGSLKTGLYALAIGAIAVLAAAPTQAQKLMVGTTADYPPFEWVDGKGKLVGFDMDVMRAISYLEKYEIELKDVSFDTIIPSLQSDKYDIAAGIQINDERRKIIDSSEPYIEVLYGVAVVKDSPENLFTVFQKGKKVGAQRGTTQARWITKRVVEQGIDVKLELYDTNDLGILDLVNKRIDGFVSNTLPLQEFVKRNPIRISGVIYDLRAHFAYLVKKGDPKGLVPKLNSGMAKMKADGSWDDLKAAYFTGDLLRITDCNAKHGDTLNVKRDIKKYAADLKGCLVP